MTATIVRPTVTPTDLPKSPPAAAGTGFRVDIQGMRAVAVLLVVLYHAHVPGLRAGYVGVDVFFVISGFLITGQIVREFDRTRRVDLVAFYARRMRRLLPAALLVTIATVVVARFWGPLLQIKSTAVDALYTSIYGINFRLAAEGVNYQQANSAPSPLQHFWSLAVEEQFYLVWPVLAIVSTLLIRRRWPNAIRPVLAVVVSVGTIASLLCSYVITQHSAPTAYFSVQTRAWEFGFGAIVALTAGLLVRVPRALAIVASWAGLAMILGAAFGYSDSTAFPGTAALLPVGGAALLILSGVRSNAGEPDGFDRFGASRPLGVRPVQWIGRWSYSWYLWHWPVLVLAPAIIGHSLSWFHQVELCALALWLAALTYATVERGTQRGRLRRTPWLLRGLALSGAGVLIATLIPLTRPDGLGTNYRADVVALSNPVSTSQLANLLRLSSVNHPVPSNLQPSLENAANDVPITQSGCHLDFLQVKQALCAYGDLASSKTMVLFGDSHAQQWDAALINVAQKKHWRLINWTKAACPAADVSLRNPLLKRVYTECDQWRTATIKRINLLHPALVLVSQSDTVPGGTTAYNRYWANQTLVTMQALKSSGARLGFLSDTPIPKSDIPSCLAAHVNDVYACELTRKNVYGSVLYASRHQLVASTLSGAGITVIDPVNWLCSPQICPVVVGNRLVYRDNSHLTNSYSSFLWPLMASALTPLMASAPGKK